MFPANRSFLLKFIDHAGAAGETLFSASSSGKLPLLGGSCCLLQKKTFLLQEAGGAHCVAFGRVLRSNFRFNFGLGFGFIIRCMTCLGGKTEVGAKFATHFPIFWLSRFFVVSIFQRFRFGGFAQFRPVLLRFLPDVSVFATFVAF